MAQVLSRRIASVVLAISCLFSLVADAQMYRDGPPPQHRVVYRDMSLVRLNPLGLISDARFMYRYRLFESDSLALRDNFVSVGLAPVLSAAFTRIGVQAEVQPLTILNLWALYEWVGYYGAFNYLQSFPSATSAHDDTTLGNLGSLAEADPAKNYSTSGTQLTFGANLTLKVKDIVVRTQAKIARPDMNLRDGDKVYYDIFYDTLVENGGWILNNDTDLLWQHPGGRLTAGIRWTQTQALYTDASFRADEPREGAPGMLHRVGPLAAYTWKKADGAPFEGTLLAVLNWWLSNPNRTGQDVSQAMPYLVIAYAITGDITPNFMKD